MLFFFLYPVFILVCILIMLYLVHRLVYVPLKRRSAPEGKRIKHRMLKEHLKSKYGDKDGTKVYKDFVDSLRKKGYY